MLFCSANLGKDDILDGQRVADYLIYVDRLQAIKILVEQRIGALGGHDEHGSQTAFSEVDIASVRTSLIEVLASPVSLSLFTEFQDRRRRASLVQFWLTVEGLKDPLEDLPDSQELAPAGDDLIFDAVRAKTVQEDARMLWETYFDPATVESPLHGNPQELAFLRAFVATNDEDMSMRQVGQAKRTIIAIQHQILDEMIEVDYPAFTQTALYASALAAIKSTPIHTNRPKILKAMSQPSLKPPKGPRDRSQTTSQDYSLSQTGTFSDVASRRVTPPSKAPGLAPPAPIGLRRTDTAPPQVNFQPAIVSRRGEEVETAAWSRPHSSDSLSFLMASPSVDRAPLFDEESGVPNEEALDDDWTTIQTIDAIQDALNSILASDSQAVHGSRDTRVSARASSVHSHISTESAKTSYGKMSSVAPHLPGGPSTALGNGFNNHYAASVDCRSVRNQSDLASDSF